MLSSLPPSFHPFQFADLAILIGLGRVMLPHADSDMGISFVCPIELNQTIKANFTNPSPREKSSEKKIRKDIAQSMSISDYENLGHNFELAR